jgi:hypothetical protein
MKGYWPEFVIFEYRITSIHKNGKGPGKIPPLSMEIQAVR